MIGLWKAGKSDCDIGCALGISKTCVKHLVQKYDQTQQSKTNEKVRFLQAIDGIIAMRESRRNC